LDANTLVHLSRMPALTGLAFHLSDTLPDQIAPSDSPLIFPNLHDLELNSQSLATVSRLLAQTRLPVMKYLSASIDYCPPKQSVSSFLAALQTSGVGHTIQRLTLGQRYPSPILDLLGLEDLQPLMEFSNLRRITICVGCNFHLTNSEVQALISAWPHFEHLRINSINHPRPNLET
jgi:hypothetical protein